MIAEVCAACHPLVVAPSAVVVWAVEPATWEGCHEPAEERLVTLVHSEGDLRLAPVPAEVAFADEQANEQAFVEFGRHCAFTPGLDELPRCFTVRLHVEHSWPQRPVPWAAPRAAPQTSTGCSTPASAEERARPRRLALFHRKVARGTPLRSRSV